MGLHQAYPPKMTKPMREQLTSVGVNELLTAADVHDVIGDGRQLVLINSVCGCAAANARPAMKLIAQGDTDVQLLTVFAGVHQEATAALRELIEQPPSSPSFALFEDGKCVYFMARSQIEGRERDAIADDLRAQL